MDGPKFAVLIPAFNEASYIQRVVKESLSFSDEVLVLDDGSDDATRKIAKLAGAKVLRNEIREGLGSALNKGFNYLFESGFKFVATIDGDAAHNPNLIPKIIDHHIKIGADLTIGNRLSSHITMDSFPSPKRSANQFATLLLRETAGVNISDVASGMRVAGIKILTLSNLAKDYGYSFELVCSASQNDLIVSDYPISVRYNSENLFATREEELVSLLFASKRFSLFDKILPKIDQIIQKIERFESFCVEIRNRLFYFYFLKFYNSYLIQEQHQYYKSISSTKKVIRF